MYQDTIYVSGASGDPVPGLILIGLGLFIWFLVRFMRAHRLTFRLLFGALGLYLLALIAPSAIVWFKKRWEAAQEALNYGKTPPRHLASPPAEENEDVYTGPKAGI